MKVASYIFYLLAFLSLVAGIAAATFAKEDYGHVFGTGTLFVFGGAVVLCLILGIACTQLAARND